MANCSSSASGDAIQSKALFVTKKPCDSSVLLTNYSMSKANAKSGGDSEDGDHSKVTRESAGELGRKLHSDDHQIDHLLKMGIKARVF